MRVATPSVKMLCFSFSIRPVALIAGLSFFRGRWTNGGSSFWTFSEPWILISGYLTHSCSCYLCNLALLFSFFCFLQSWLHVFCMGEAWLMVDNVNAIMKYVFAWNLRGLSSVILFSRTVGRGLNNFRKILLYSTRDEFFLSTTVHADPSINSTSQMIGHI